MKKCEKFWFPKHKFENWDVVDKGNIQRSLDNKITGSYMIQERKCTDCGLKQRNIIRNIIVY